MIGDLILDHTDAGGDRVRIYKLDATTLVVRTSGSDAIVVLPVAKLVNALKIEGMI